MKSAAWILTILQWDPGVAVLCEDNLPVLADMEPFDDKAGTILGAMAHELLLVDEVGESERQEHLEHVDYPIQTNAGVTPLRVFIERLPPEKR